MSEADWSSKATWMRRVGATGATFAPTGELLSLSLGPEAPEAATGDEAPQHEDSADAVRARAELRKQLSLRATPGLVPRVGRDA